MVSRIDIGLRYGLILTDAVPEWVRARRAMQYGYSIQEWIELMQEGNNGSNPGSWLLGDAYTNEIARFEQGYIFQHIEYKKDGYFFGCNCVEDPRIRNLECTAVGYNDIRRQTGGRRSALKIAQGKNGQHSGPKITGRKNSITINSSERLSQPLN